MLRVNARTENATHPSPPTNDRPNPKITVLRIEEDLYELRIEDDLAGGRVKINTTKVLLNKTKPDPQQC